MARGRSLAFGRTRCRAADRLLSGARPQLR